MTDLKEIDFENPPDDLKEKLGKVDKNAFSQSTKHDFDLEVVISHFTDCQRLQDNSLDLKEYLSAYYELCRFFRLTGRLFGFVANDLESKLKAIAFHLNCPQKGEHYTSIDSMVQYEVAQRTTHVKSPRPSGCRMLLRLHRALEFILHFMRAFRDSDESAKSSKLAWTVYSKTLCHHHPWITRKVAYVGVHALPSKRRLVEAMCKQDYHRVMELLLKVFEVGQPVYDRTQELLAKANLLNIP